MSHTTHAL